MTESIKNYPNFKPVVRMSEVETYVNEPPGGHPKLGGVHARIGRALGAQMLGMPLSIVDPGKRAFPRHNHHANEEMFVILEGQADYIFGEDRHAVQAGDVCFAPIGGHATAHALENTGTTQLKYLALSTMNDPDIGEYPDSGKFAAFRKGGGSRLAESDFAVVARLSDGKVPYWEGET